MPWSIRVHQHGGPEVLKWEEVALPAPGEGEVRVRHTSVGLNFIDVYLRTGLYASALPMTPGQEAAGVVEAVGPGVTALKPGDRVAYAGLQGAYCEARNAPAARLVKLPDDIPDEIASAMMLKGMTAEYLLRRTRPIGRGDTLVFHAAAGGVGLIASQWANALGAEVIGVVGSREKAELARAHGCRHVVVTPDEDLVSRVRELTSGQGVPVVYDSVGKDTFMKSLDCLARRGMLVLFGQSSGKVPPFDPGLLAQKGSLYLTRPSLAAYTATREELEESANALFEVVRRGQVRIDIRQRYPLREVARAHADLEARRTTGSTVLTV